MYLRLRLVGANGDSGDDHSLQDVCGDGSFDNNAFNIVCTTVYLIEIIFILSLLQRGYSEKKKTATERQPSSYQSYLPFPIYYTFLKFASLLIALRAMILSIMILSGDTSASFTLLSVSVVHPLGACVSEGLAFFLMQRGVGARAVRHTRNFVIVWFVVYASFGLVSWLIDSESGGTAHFVPRGSKAFWVILDCSRILFYLVVLLIGRRRHPTRKSLFVFGIFTLVVYASSTVADLLLGQGDGAACGVFIIWSVWTVVWPGLTYYTLLLDSQYWGSSGADAVAVIDSDVESAMRSNGSYTDVLSSNNNNNNNKTKKSNNIYQDPTSPLLLLNDTASEKNKFLFSYHEVTLLEEIGSGGTSTVYRGLFRGRLVAVKKFSVELLTPTYIQRFAQEMSFSSRLQHTNLVRTVGVCLDIPHMCLIQENMEKGSLFHVLKREHATLSVAQRLSMARDAAAGLAFLHAQRPPVLHRDMKSLNLLIDRQNCLKLADFGEAREYHADANELMTSERGTPHWMAPELFTSGSYTEKVDIYSLGVVLYEIATGKRPWADVNPWMIPTRVVERKERPSLEDAVEGIPPPFLHIIERCWAHAMDDRPSADTVAKEINKLVLLLASSPANKPTTDDEAALFKTF